MFIYKFPSDMGHCGMEWDENSMFLRVSKKPKAQKKKSKWPIDERANSTCREKANKI